MPASRPNASARLNPWTLVIWVVAVFIAIFFATVDMQGTVLDGAYLPRGNDSFYHARRILDAALGERGFYQFDDHLQAPDGTWIPWPWAYDYLVAQALRLALWIVPTLDPMRFIAYVPVAWVTVNAALFLAIARTIGLSRELSFLAMICFALSPLTQLLHNIGMIDHHFIEHTFVLLNVWLGLRWFERPGDARRAALLAAALGAAPAFHSGLFILQLVPLATVFVLWLRHGTPPAAALRTFAAVLVIVTQLVLIPSEPYRSGLFEFGLLSWFHFYVACCTAAAVAFLSWRPFSRLTLAGFGGLCLALALPLGLQVMSGFGFLSGNFSILDDIVEAQSPYRMLMGYFGFDETLSFYSWLLLLVPAVLGYYVYRAVRERDAARLFYAIAVVFGLTLLLQQFRLQYYGFFGLVTGSLLIVEQLRESRQWHRGALFVAALAMVTLAYQLPLRQRLFVVYAPGADVEYASALQIYSDLGDLCAANPGVVLASADDGNAILFHSNCSVIANNFILRPEDEAHIQEIDRLMRLTPAEVRSARPDVRYLFIRVRDFSVLQGDTAYIVESVPLAKLLLDEEPSPEGFTLIKTVRRRIGPEGEAGVFARLYAVAPPQTPSP